jgi:GTPase SAR1 family protein
MEQYGSPVYLYQLSQNELARLALEFAGHEAWGRIGMFGIDGNIYSRFIRESYLKSKEERYMGYLQQLAVQGVSINDLETALHKVGLTALEEYIREKRYKKLQQAMRKPSPSQATISVARADVAIVCRARESEPLISALNALGITVTNNKHLNACEISTKDGLNKVRCIIAHTDDPIFTQQLWSKVKFRYIMSIGLCAGHEEDVGKVMFFDKAVRMEKDSSHLVSSSVNTWGVMEAWRQLKDTIPIVKPDFNNVIATTPVLLPNVTQTLAGLNDVISKTSFKKCSARVVDLDAAFLFSFEEKNDEAEVLCAIRAISAPGGKTDDSVRETAIHHLATALVTYLRLLNDIINPDPSVPSEIIRRGPEAIHAYRDALKNGKMKSIRCKLMVLGQERVGKTCLLRAMTGQPFDEQQASTHVLDICDINVGEWRMDRAIIRSIPPTVTHQVREEPVEPGLSNSEPQQLVYPPNTGQSIAVNSNMLQPIDESASEVPITFSTWDFAGQDMYYTIHRMFITDRAFYIVAFSLREAVDDINHGTTKFIDNINFWIKSISYYTSIFELGTDVKSTLDNAIEDKTPKIIIVGTRLDELKEEETKVYGEISDAIKEGIFIDPRDGKCLPVYDMLVLNEDKKFITFFPASNKYSDGIKSLTEHIENHIRDLRDEGFLREEFPITWIRMQEEIRKQVMHGKTVVTYKEFVQLAVDVCSVKEDDKSLETLIQFLHDTGQIIYYPDIEGNEEKLIVMDPRWLVDRTKELVPKAEVKLKRLKQSEQDNLLTGSADIVVLNKLWKDYNSRYLINLMEKFGLLCTSDGNEFDIPLSKPTKEPKWNLPRDLTCYFKFDRFLPEALFHYLVGHLVDKMRQSRSSFRPTINRYASVVLVAEQRTYLQLYPDELHIKVIIEPTDGHTPHEVIETIESIINSPTDLWAQRLSFKVRVECPQCYNEHGGTVELNHPEHCDGRDQCTLTAEQKQKLQNTWDSMHRSPQPRTLASPQPKTLDSLEALESLKIAKKLARCSNWTFVGLCFKTRYGWTITKKSLSTEYNITNEQEYCEKLIDKLAERNITVAELIAVLRSHDVKLVALATKFMNRYDVSEAEVQQATEDLKHKKDAVAA